MNINEFQEKIEQIFNKGRAMNINEFQEKREQIFNKAIETYGGLNFPCRATLMLVDNAGDSIKAHGGLTFPCRATLMLVDDAGYYITASDFIRHYGLFFLDSTKTYHLGAFDDNNNFREIIAFQQASDPFQLLPLFKELSEVRGIADLIGVNVDGLQWDVKSLEELKWQIQGL